MTAPCGRPGTNRWCTEDRPAARPLFLGLQTRLASRQRGWRALRAEAGKLAFGTIDSWLIWKLTGGTRHVTDATNAARTLLYNIREGRWDDDILKLLNIPESLLPEVLDTGADFGTSTQACSATPFRSSALRAISRPRRWGRPVSRRAC
jgi:glycerol kinase